VVGLPWCTKLKAAAEDKGLLECLGAKRPGGAAKEKQAEHDKASKKVFTARLRLWSRVLLLAPPCPLRRPETETAPGLLSKPSVN